LGKEDSSRFVGDIERGQEFKENYLGDGKTRKTSELALASPERLLVNSTT
jgi:hypothetical protein